MLDTILLAIEIVGVISFAVAGAVVAIDKETDIFGVVFLALMTCFGGGIIRDVLVREVPVVLRSDFYATASLMGGILYYFLHRCGIPVSINFFITSLFVFSVRFLAIYFKFQLPEVHRIQNHRHLSNKRRQK